MQRCFPPIVLSAEVWVKPFKDMGLFTYFEFFFIFYFFKSLSQTGLDSLVQVLYIGGSTVQKKEILALKIWFVQSFLFLYFTKPQLINQGPVCLASTSEWPAEKTINVHAIM